MFVFVYLIIFLVIFYNFYWKRRNFPPGPTPWPFLGNLNELEKTQPSYKIFEVWSRRYGPVFTYWIGEIPFVAITDFQIIKDTFIKDGDAYAGRDFFNEGFHHLTEKEIKLESWEFYKEYRNEVPGIIRTQGEEWRTLRRFIIQSFRDLGVGRTEMERKIINEVESLFEVINFEIEKHLEEVDLMSAIDVAVGSVITQLVFGFRFNNETVDEFHKLKQTIYEGMLMTSARTTKLVLLMPWLRHFWKFGANFREFDANVSEQFKFFDQQISTQLKRQKLESNYFENFVDAFIQKINSSINECDVNNDRNFFTIEALRAICFEIYGAGQETTSNTMNFVVLYMILNEQKQQKMQNEMDKIIVEKRRILMSDRSQLPFTNAESQRLANLLPENLPHRTMQNVEIYGYKISKGTRIVPQISAVLYNEKIFPNPDKFIPERFLNEAGELRRIDEFVPFSVGKRQCLGEPLAKMELFLFTANIFYNYEITMVDRKNPPSLEKITGTTVSPLVYKCRIERRL